MASNGYVFAAEGEGRSGEYGEVKRRHYYETNPATERFQNRPNPMGTWPKEVSLLRAESVCPN